MSNKFIALVFAISIAFSLHAQKKENLSNLYQQLLDEGWHRKEIDRLSQSYIQENSGIGSRKDKAGTPLPIPNSQLLQNLSQVHKWADLYSEDYENFETLFPESKETSNIVAADKIEPNKRIKRLKGLWKHVAMYSTSGRIYDLELHPVNPKVMYANPDGDGIFKTTDGGISWSSITDNIPDRLNRDTYENITVDPANFDHVFSISRFGQMYETENGGKNWNRIINSEDKKGRAPQFKWVEAFRNAADKMILIGSVTKKSGLNHGWETGVYRSDNGGKSWNMLKLTDTKFQEMAFHKQNKDIVYLGAQSKIYKSVDAGITFSLIKDFKFGNRPMFVSTLSGNDVDALYIVASEGDNTQVYYSADRGETWELRQDSKNKLGFERGIFGGHGSSGWTSFFEVDPFDKNHLIASNVASCESFDGGRNWEVQSWSTRANAQMPDGSRPLAPHGSHNADNHALKFHPAKKGFKVKACDAGIMMKEVADTNWVNINGNMPAFLWYSLVVNEFGDRYVAGNTQDVNIQTYRYNQWENDRGYEGDAIFMNPSTNTTYYPVAKTEKGEGLNFLEPGFWKMHSWSYPKVAVNYKNLDEIYIAYGRRPTEPEAQLPKFLYVSHNRGVSFDRVPNMGDKEIFSVQVSRSENSILTAFTATDVMTTQDGGKSWDTNKYPEGFKGTMRNRKVSGCVNPLNPSQMWVGGDKGEIIHSTDGGITWSTIKGSLPDGPVLELLFHEGTKGDLYALVKGYGVFYRSAQDSDWKLWLKGFNLTDFAEIRIDYPTQKLLGASYGRGLWEADLEKTVDRFFDDNFKIVAEGEVNGKCVFQMDTDLVIPAYYNYSWTINGEKTSTNSQVLITEKLKKDDLIALELSPIYSTDVKKTSTYQVTSTEKHKIERGKSNSLFLKERFINAGYVDLFGANKNFTFSTWIKPITEGVIASNRRTFFRDAKGWYLEVTKEGRLHFNAAFYQNRSFNKTFDKGVDQSLSITSADSTINFNQWAHIAVAVNRNKTITLYLNGKAVASSSLESMPSELSLNHVMDFTLFADTYGKRKMIGEIRDAAIHSQELQQNEIIRFSKVGCKQSDNLAFYINFKNNKPKSLKELFSKRDIELRQIK